MLLRIDRWHHEASLSKGYDEMLLNMIHELDASNALTNNDWISHGYLATFYIYINNNS